MNAEYIFRQCAECAYIEDCPEPFVNLEGKPVHPKYCPKEEEVKLCHRPRMLTNEFNGNREPDQKTD